MRIATMYFSILQAPRARIHSIANFCSEGFHSLSSCRLHGSTSKLLASKSYGFEGGYSRRWFKRSMSTETGGKSTNNQRNKASSIVDEFLDQKISKSTAVDVNMAGVHDIQKIRHYESEEEIAKGKDLASLVTVIVFDIETTAISRKHGRIVEFASLDLSGGKDSTFQTLVNPERNVPNPRVHGITTHMVRRPDVPRWTQWYQQLASVDYFSTFFRMEDLIPILVKYVESRKKPGGQLLLVAHNGRGFDVPFLISEFNRCSYEIPEDWMFVDTLVLARKLIKTGGTSLPSKLSLEALREHYDIGLVGRAHRAMSDVYSLSQILQKLTFDLKLSVSDLLEEAFTAADVNRSRKKKNSS